MESYEQIKKYYTDNKKNHRLYNKEFQILVETLYKKWSHRTQLYEMCITMSPTKGYWEYDPDEQYEELCKIIRKYALRHRIDTLTCFEFNKNGNVHTHMLLRSEYGYERKLRCMQKYMSNKFGRTSLSEVNNFKKYFLYMVKDFGKADLDYLEIINDKPTASEIKQEKQIDIMAQTIRACQGTILANALDEHDIHHTLNEVTYRVGRAESALNAPAPYNKDASASASKG